MDFYRAMANQLERGRPVVLITVVQTKGSVPRGRGAQMAVFSHGEILGSIGGGSMEYKGILHAEHLHKEWQKNAVIPVTQRKHLHGDHAKRDKMDVVCGNGATLYFQFFAGREDGAFFRSVAKETEGNQDINLAFAVKEDGVPALLLYTKGKALAVRGPFPRPLLFAKEVWKKNAWVEREGSAYFVQTVSEAGKALVFGSGHVARTLAPVLLSVGFRVLIYDDRNESLGKAFFPAAVERVKGDFRSIGDYIPIGPGDYIVIASRNHGSDLAVLRQVLRQESRYIGMLAGRRKIDTLFSLLREEGVEETRLKKVYTPIGLPIGAETPEEIAISIAGEMIRVRATGK